MFKKSTVCTAVLMAIGGGLLVAPAFAQQSSERVEITGSRIKTLNAESTSPVQVLSAADIASSGTLNLQDLLLKNPTLGTPAISRTNSNFETSSAGVAVCATLARAAPWCWSTAAAMWQASRENRRST
jgi:iron complex outermembrane receptor protein